MKSFCRIIGDMVNRPYKLGETDCFRSIIDYLVQIGVELPESFEGWTLETYPAYYLKNPDEAKKTAIRLMDSLLPTINPGFAIAGDILLLVAKDSPPFLAIVGGNGNVITASENCGLRAYHGQYYKRLKGWSCQQQFR